MMLSGSYASVLLAGGGVTESTLALEESGYVDLPWPK